MEKPQGVMVCVTRQKNCERLINIGARFSREVGGKVHVVHVARDGTKFLDSPDEGEALDYLFRVSKQVGAEMNVLRSENVAETLKKFAEEKNVAMVILGESPGSDNTFVTRVEQEMGDREVQIIPAT